MLPLLYNEVNYNAGSYSTTPIGVIDCATMCKVKEVRNGEYALELETIINDSLADLLIPQRVIAAKPNPTDPVQYFEIRKVTRTIDGKIKIEALHVKHIAFSICSEGDQNYDGTIISFNGTPAYIWNKLVTDYLPDGTVMPFSFTSDISAAKDFALGFSVADSFGNIMGGKEGSFCDVWGGEWKFNNFAIEFKASRGQDKKYLIKYGKNISDSSQIASSEDCYTHVLPFGKVSNGDRMINFFASLVTIPNSESVWNKTFLLDCTDFLDQYEVGTHGENYSTVRAAMRSYALNYANINNLGKVKVGIEVTVRAELDEMQDISLCDTVTVMLDPFGTKATAKITEATYDVLLERWDKMVIGSPKVTVADLLIDQRRYL